MKQAEGLNHGKRLNLELARCSCAACCGTNLRVNILLTFRYPSRECIFALHWADMISIAALQWLCKYQATIIIS